MKITKSQLQKLLKEALSLKAEEEVEIEADVWGENSPRAVTKFVSFKLPKNEVENMTTVGLEEMAIETFYEEGGQGDDPYCNSLTVDGVDVQDYKDQLHLYEEQDSDAEGPPKRTFAEVEAEVWGTNSAQADKRWVKFTVKTPTSFSEIEVEAIDTFYEEGGQGDDPFVNDLKVDGNSVMEENIDVDVNVGDTVLGGKFKNKKIKVKSIESKNDIGQPTYNGGKPVLNFRIEKNMPLKITKEQLKRLIKEQMMNLFENNGPEERARKYIAGKEDPEREETDDTYFPIEKDDRLANVKRQLNDLVRDSNKKLKARRALGR
jgi:hypothetical protein